MSLWSVTAMLALSACSMTRLPDAPPGATLQAQPFKVAEKIRGEAMMSKEDLALIEESLNPIYQLGSGDTVRIDVFGRPEMSGKHIIGPDGVVTIPVVGDLALKDLTREEARTLLEGKLRRYLTTPHVTLGLEDYSSNQVTVLGRVERSGIQRFPHPPTLAEVLAGAGTMPLLDKQATLTRCAIMRGRDKLIWVDLKALLSGDPAYNLRMKRGDIVFIPDSSDTSIYVLGQVRKPGSYTLKGPMTVLDALAQAGGPSDEAQTGKIGLYRAGAKTVKYFEVSEVMDSSRSANYSLEDGDVLFVPKGGMAEFGYLMRQILPGIGLLMF
jgi:polysaccharide export outer membrane protein